MTSSSSLRIGLVGQRFMGRAHSNAFRQAATFFAPNPLPELELVCGRDERTLEDLAKRFGWRRATTRWEDLVCDGKVDLVDVATPNHLHADIAIAALEAGKHVACEKPLAATLDQARAMHEAARDAAGRTFVWFNYRRCPAIAFAWKLIREGRLGAIRHVRANYLQSWGGPETPASWRFDRATAGSGAHGDLNAHLVDLARFLLGEEIAEVHGAVSRTFIEERIEEGTGEARPSTVDDALLFLATFGSGAVASFEASRLAGPYQNENRMEIHGEQGALRWSFEDMNLLHVYDAAEDPAIGGWKRVMCTSAEQHPYVANWWPDAHLIGYEHTFTHQVADMCAVLGGVEPVVPLPDFADAFETQRVLEAALVSARERCAVPIPER